MAAIRNEPRLDDLPTERRDPAGADLDLRSTRDIVRLMGEADATVPHAVAAAEEALAGAIDEIAARLARGGRLVYVGAGTSGRLALVDAVECQSTFGLDPGRVVALVAGGADSTATAQEHAEDDAEAGAAEVKAVAVADRDAVVGISASGRTPYVLGALEAARRAGALTVGVVCVEGSPIGAIADREVAVVVGVEVLAGSTRLKAGTAQKLVLNTISTVSMIRLGKTYGNLMVDVVATNDKLRDRVRRIVEAATGASATEVATALDESHGDAKVAIVMLLGRTDAVTARERLAGTRGVVRKALGQ
jgi:N-acetylmuramic acid 6-phosphate etherase